jgi:hypothetical protein
MNQDAIPQPDIMRVMMMRSLLEMRDAVLEMSLMPNSTDPIRESVATVLEQAQILIDQLEVFCFDLGAACNGLHEGDIESAQQFIAALQTMLGRVGDAS